MGERIDYWRWWGRIKEDERAWNKIGIAALLFLSSMIIPYVGQIVVVGWGVATLRRAVAGQPGLADLDFDMEQLINYLDIGFKAFLVQLVWSLPFIAAFLLVIPAIFVMEASLAAGLVVMGLLTLLIAAFSIFMMVFMQGALLRVELSDKLGEGFAWREILAYTQRHFWLFFVTSMAGALIALPLALLGYVACFVGVFVAVPIITIVQADLLAQGYVIARNRGDDSVPVDGQLVTSLGGDVHKVFE